MIEWAKAGFLRFFSQDKDKKRRLLVALGLIGIGLIALSEWLPSRNSPTQAADSTDAATVSVAQVEAALEKRVENLVKQVDGVGECLVMVTLESSSRLIYAADYTYNTALQADSGSEKVLLVETDSGPVGLLIAELQPSVKGVAVVCTGGGDAAVRREVTSLIGAALNLSSGRIYVTKQK